MDNNTNNDEEEEEEETDEEFLLLLKASDPMITILDFDPMYHSTSHVDATIEALHRNRCVEHLNLVVSGMMVSQMKALIRSMNTATKLKSLDIDGEDLELSQFFECLIKQQQKMITTTNNNDIAANRTTGSIIKKSSTSKSNEIIYHSTGINNNKNGSSNSNNKIQFFHDDNDDGKNNCSSSFYFLSSIEIMRTITSLEVANAVSQFLAGKECHLMSLSLRFGHFDNNNDDDDENSAPHQHSLNHTVLRKILKDGIQKNSSLINLELSGIGFNFWSPVDVQELVAETVLCRWRRNCQIKRNNHLRHQNHNNDEKKSMNELWNDGWQSLSLRGFKHHGDCGKLLNKLLLLLQQEKEENLYYYKKRIDPPLLPFQSLQSLCLDMDYTPENIDINNLALVLESCAFPYLSELHISCGWGWPWTIATTTAAPLSSVVSSSIEDLVRALSKLPCLTTLGLDLYGGIGIANQFRRYLQLPSPVHDIGTHPSWISRPLLESSNCLMKLIEILKFSYMSEEIDNNDTNTPPDGINNSSSSNNDLSLNNHLSLLLLDGCSNLLSLQLGVSDEIFFTGVVPILSTLLNLSIMDLHEGYLTRLSVVAADDSDDNDSSSNSSNDIGRNNNYFFSVDNSSSAWANDFLPLFLQQQQPQTTSLLSKQSYWNHRLDKLVLPPHCPLLTSHRIYLEFFVKKIGRKLQYECNVDNNDLGNSTNDDNDNDLGDNIINNSSNNKQIEQNNNSSLLVDRKYCLQQNDEKDTRKKNTEVEEDGLYSYLIYNLLQQQRFEIVYRLFIQQPDLLHR